MDENFDPRLIFVVAATMQIVNAQNRFKVRENILFQNKVADLFGDHRRAAKPTPYINLKAKRPFRVFLDLEANVMHLNGGPVMLCCCYRNFELARQEREFGVQG